MKALISDITLTGHPISVGNAFVLGYNASGGSISSSDYVVKNDGLETDLQYAVDNDISVVIRSTTGASSNLDIALNQYPDATLFMPSGSNTPSDLQFDYPIPQVICVTGAGDVENETAINIEFFAPDPIESDDQDYSSYSNGYIAGQLLYIKDTLDCTMWEARYRARMTGSENGIWDSNNGFGLIDVASAIAYSGEIAQDPFYVALSYDLTTQLNSVKLTFNLTTEKTIYRKGFYDSDYTEIATTSLDVYEDETITRHAKPYTYKVNDIEQQILFTNITLFERN